MCKKEDTCNHRQLVWLYGHFFEEKKNIASFKQSSFKKKKPRLT